MLDETVEALVDGPCHDACRSVLGAVAWIVLTRVELAVYVQALQRRAHAPRVTDCKRLNRVIRYMKRHKCGLKTVCVRHPLTFVGFTDVAFKAHPDERIGLALRGLAATMQQDAPTNDQPHSVGGLANLLDFTVRRQRRVVRSTSSAELNGLVDGVVVVADNPASNLLLYTQVAGGNDRSACTWGLIPVVRRRGRCQSGLRCSRGNRCL